jgi:hypothetical protein
MVSLVELSVQFKEMLVADVAAAVRPDGAFGGTTGGAWVVAQACVL